MSRLPITVATWDYDRVRAFTDGRVMIEGCDVNYITMPVEECFERAFFHGEFEVAEIGFSPFLLALSRGPTPYVAIPVFLSRMFRHSAVYIRSERGINGPAELRGKTIGVPEYQMSAVLWLRGYLKDEFGFAPKDINWVQAGLENPGRRDKFPLNLPDGFPLVSRNDASLSKLLADGEIDGVMSARTPSCYSNAHPQVRRLFPDYRTAERDYYRKTGIFPIMHMFGKTPYYALNQMTKMGVRTGPDCRSDVAGLYAAVLAQAGCANHFAGFHIGLCVGNGWIAGKSAVEDLGNAPTPRTDPAQVQHLHAETARRLNAAAAAESDRILRDLQQIMFAYDIGILKQADRLERAREAVTALAAQARELNALHVHELVRLRETEAMLLAAQFILGASLYRTESRLSHFREDHPHRDDDTWLCWVDIADTGGAPAFARTPIPLPYCGAAAAPAGVPTRLRKQAAIGGV